MAKISDIIGEKVSEALLEAKDVFKKERILDENPSLLNNDEFEKWAIAQGKVRVLELLAEGKDFNDTMKVVNDELDIARSKQQVNFLRKKKNDRDHEKLVKRHNDYKPMIDPERGE